MNLLESLNPSQSFNELALFAGHGGGILGGKLLGWKTVCAVENDRYARRVLMARQDDGCLEPFPIWDDVRTFDGRPWAGLVDVVSGGFPCQDISAAGRGRGLRGARSGLWREMVRIVCEVAPEWVFVENSPRLTSRGLPVVLKDLSLLGYDAAWGVLGAAQVGAPHKRDRIWIVAHRAGQRSPAGVADSPAGPKGEPGFPEHRREVSGALADADGARQLQPQRTFAEIGQRFGDHGQVAAYTDLSGCSQQRQHQPGSEEYTSPQCGDWWSTEPDVGRVAHGVASRVDRLRGLGNGQVPAVAALAFQILSARLLSQFPTSPNRPQEPLEASGGYQHPIRDIRGQDALCTSLHGASIWTPRQNQTPVLP